MNMIRLVKLLLTGGIICSLILANFCTIYAQEIDFKPTFFYIGSEIGLVEPVVKKFRHKKTKSDFTLKKSNMYSVKLGYSFYPQMAIEFSATYQPKYHLHYILPETPLIPKTPGMTKVASNIYMLNLVYDLNKVAELTPFVILGAGIAQVKISPTSSFWDVTGQGDNKIEYFKIKKYKNNCFAWQIGLGFSREITNNFSIDVAAKLQVAHSIRIKYDTLDMNTHQFIPATPIKKTIGVGEFGIGFTYKLPI